MVLELITATCGAAEIATEILTTIEDGMKKKTEDGERQQELLISRIKFQEKT